MKIPAAHVALGFAGVLLLAGASSSQALPGAGTVDSGDIKNGEVKRADIASNAINSAKVAPNSLTGAEIAESTLGSRFARTHTSLAGTPPAKVASAGGLEVWAGCFEDPGNTSDHYAEIKVRSTIDGARVSMAVFNGLTGQAMYYDLNAGDEFPVGGGEPPGYADLVYSTPAGKVVEAHIGWAGLDVGPNKCVMHGVVTG